jgi:hypothetical protein
MAMLESRQFVVNKMIVVVRNPLDMIVNWANDLNKTEALNYP